MSKGLIDLLLDSIFDADWKGRRGEKLTERELNFVRLLGRDGKVLRNIYVPKEDGNTSEIDVVFITQKGIFVIESKNYSGWVFGDEKSVYWTTVLPNKTKSRFYNPVMQNGNHIKWLGRYLGNNIPMYSIIAFSERCELKQISLTSKDINVIKRDRLYSVIRNIWDKTEDCLNEEQVDRVFARLLELTDVDKATKTAHIVSINEKQKNSSSNTMKCPRCGGDLVLRTAKQGLNAGNRFYGCSNYPKCRYTQKSSDK